MGSLVGSLTDNNTTAALVNMLSFTEARQQVIAENVANLGLPGYATRQLDGKAFQTALRGALDERAADPNKPLTLAETEEFGSRPDGTLRVTPVQWPQNARFHDRTDASVERQMSELAETSMMHQAASTLLKTRFDDLRKAIRGRV
jgi:flagellar basal-body rod protein FlgB